MSAGEWFDKEAARRARDATMREAGSGDLDREIAKEAADEAARLKEARGEPIAGKPGEAEPPEATRAITAYDELDELAIADEMAGRVIPEYFYRFQAGGREIVGISVAGVKAIARHMSNHGESITVLEARFEDGEDQDGPFVGCLVQVRNLRTQETRWAYASQAKTMKLRSGQRVPDPFAKTKALNKAQRNGLRQFIPETVVVEMFREWRRQREGQKPPGG